MTVENPFIISGYSDPMYFCDREEETAKIIDALKNERNVTLISPRRMGKTGLIKNVFHKMSKENKGTVCIYIDIFATTTMSEFVELFANSVMGKLDSDIKNVLTRIGKFFKSIRPTISFDSSNGNPTYSFDIDKGQEETTLKEIFDFLSSSERRCYIGIDEFQQISTYPDGNIEALLRSYTQFCPNVSFIFSGSKQHLMQEMFLSAKRPFFQSTQIMNIGVIDKKKYFDFAKKHFKNNGFTIKKLSFDYLYDTFEGHTWYVQAVLNRLYSYRRNIEDKEIVDSTISAIVEENSYHYNILLASYTANNVSLLKAIAREGIVEEINASEFIQKHKLKTSSSVNTSLYKLVDLEVIYKSERGYSVYDRMMSMYLRQLMF